MDSSGAAPPESGPESIRSQRIAWACLVLVLLGLALWTLREFVAALVWAAVLAVAFWPSYQSATRRLPPGRHNILLPAAFTFAIALLFVLPIVLAGMQAAREARTVAVWMENARNQGVPAPDFVTHLPMFADPVRNWWRDNLADPAAVADLEARLRNPENVWPGVRLGSRSSIGWSSSLSAC